MRVRRVGGETKQTDFGESQVNGVSGHTVGVTLLSECLLCTAEGTWLMHITGICLEIGPSAQGDLVSGCNNNNLIRLRLYRTL